MEQESHYTHKEPCPNCGSRDNLARYTDGHGYCFGCGHYEPSEGGPTTSTTRPKAVSKEFNPYRGDFRALNKRGLSEDTCRHFGYSVGMARIQVEPGKFEDRLCHIAPYYKKGELVAQHVRDAEKNFAWAGSPKDCELFGQHLWRDGGKKVVVTEGEIDCMTVSQLQNNKWPVVSIPNGADAAKKFLAANLEWLERFDEVILMFDMDTSGKEAIEECAPLFTPGRCKVASLSMKDPNELLLAGKGAEVIEAIWAAKPYRPDGIRSIAELAEMAEKDIPRGHAWFLPTLDELTFGRREGEIYAFGAGTGVGKTDLFTQSIAFDVMTLGLTVGVLYLEQPPVETVRRIAGKVVGKVLHVPGKATVEERREAIAKLSASEKLHLYDSFGSADWDTIKAKIRYMAVGLGCKSIYFDHLTALTAHEEDERKALDRIMAELAALALELGVFIHFISHLTRPEGKPHEEGGRVQIKHFRGSNSIGMWSHFMFGLERDQQATEPEERLTTFRVLKDRNTGQATGKTITLDFDPETGLLHEVSPSSVQGSQFRDRSSSKTEHQEF